MYKVLYFISKPYSYYAVVDNKENIIARSRYLAVIKMHYKVIVDF